MINLIETTFLAKFFLNKVHLESVNLFIIFFGLEEGTFSLIRLIF